MSSPAETTGRSFKILVADDVPENVRLLEIHLRRPEYQILKAYDGQQALEVAQRELPDLILLDVMMPKLDGCEVCQRLKSEEHTRLIPVVLITVLDQMEAKLRGIESGADDFLNKPVNKTELRARVASLLRVKQYTDELERAETLVTTLALTVEARDPYTEGHCDRLSRYAVALGKVLGRNAEELKALRLGGVLHDIGKIAIPDSILLKAGKLTKVEMEVIRQHTIIGERICRPLRSLHLVLPIIRHHHERRDGTGYPDGLRGEQIPLLARILQTVDVYDALCTERPYKPALSREVALATMREEAARGWWDSHLVETFVTLPPAEQIELSQKETAANDPHKFQPQLKTEQ